MNGSAEVQALAGAQHGVVTRAQLMAAGLSAAAIDARVRSSRLRPLHLGVYVLGSLEGPLLPVRARTMAAVLACGPGAVASHESGAALWGMVPEPAGPVHVSLSVGDRGRRPGIRPHRVGALPASQVTSVERIPVTTPARTLIDLAGRVRARELEQALAYAQRRGLVIRSGLTSLLGRCGPRRGVRRLRRLVEGSAEPAWSRSVAEERFLALVRAGRLPEPRVNARVGPYQVDFLWRRPAVVVEVDGFAYHRSRRSFEADRRRDAELVARGLRVVRVTWRQIEAEPHALLVRLARVLTRSGSSLPGRG